MESAQMIWHARCIRSHRRFSWRCGVSKILRGAVAGWGANKMGCGCFGTVIAFFILYSLLGNFGIFR